MLGRRGNWQWVPGLLAFIWFVGVIVSYYITHKPFSPQFALNLAWLLGQVGIAFGILSVAGGLGRRLRIPLEVHRLTRLALQAALGLGLLGIAVLVAGALGFLRPLVGWGGLFVLGVILWPDLLGWWRDWGDLSVLWDEGGRIGRAIAVGVALILLSTLSIALAPAVKFDTLVYHLTLPHIYLSASRVVYVPQIMYWGMPQTGEMLYTWAIMLVGDPAATVLGWGVGLLALVGLGGYVTDRFSPTAAWVSVASLVSGFTLASELSWGYVDWLVILYGLSFLVAIDRWAQTRWRGELLLAGVFAGLALGTKYTAGVLLLSALAFTSWKSRGKASLKGLFLVWFQISFAVILVALPWFVKNILATGNPVYPFLFSAGAMDKLRLGLYQGGKPWGDWQDFLLLPLRATFYGVEGSPGYSASIGPLFLGLCFAAWLSWNSQSSGYRATIASAAWIAFPGILVWMFAGRFSSYLLQSRLYFALFPALAVLAGAGFANLRRYNLPGVRLGRIAGFMMLFVLGLNVLELGVETLRRGAPQAALGLRGTEAYLEDNLGWHAPAMKAIRDLPSGARVLMLWEPRSLYCLPKCEPDEILDRWLGERYGSPSASPRGPEEIMESWKQAGYSHLLFYRLGADFIRAESTSYHESDWQALNVLLEGLPIVQEFGGTYTMYELDP